MDAQLKTVISTVTPLLKNKDHMGVIKILKRAIDDGIQHELVFGMLASSYAEVGMTDKAQENFAKVIQLNPQNYLAFFQMGMLLYNAGDIAKAIDAWVNVSSQSGEFVANYWIAKAYVDLGKSEQAKPYLHQAKTHVPSDHVLYDDVMALYNEQLGDI